MPRPTILGSLSLSFLCALVASRSALAAEAYAADPVHSSIVYRVKHMNATYFWGRFNNITGSFAPTSQNVLSYAKRIPVGSKTKLRPDAFHERGRFGAGVEGVRKRS